MNKEEIQKQINELKQKTEELEKALQKIIDELKQKAAELEKALQKIEEEEEWPKVGDIYYTPDFFQGKVTEREYNNYPSENRLKSFGLMFPTQEECECFMHTRRMRMLYGWTGAKG